jgi:hypothetical protein
MGPRRGGTQGIEALGFAQPGRHSAGMMGAYPDVAIRQITQHRNEDRDDSFKTIVP